MKKALMIQAVFSVMILLIGSGVNLAWTAGKIKIGVSQYGLKNEYLLAMCKAQKEAAARFNVNLDIFDGNYDVKTQCNNFDYMIANGYDAIIVTPVEGDVLAGAVEKAARKGIPVISVSTPIKSDRLTSYIGCDDTSAGEMVMRFLAKKMDGQGNVVILEGQIGNPSQIERRKGIHKALADFPKIKVLSEKAANWSRAEGFALMENWLSTFPDKINAVCAQNDEMALGAVKALEQKKLNLPVAGIDGIYDGLTAIREKRLTATCFMDAERQGALSIEVALRVLKRKKVNKNYWTPFELVTSRNVKDFLSKRKP